MARTVRKTPLLLRAALAALLTIALALALAPGAAVRAGEAAAGRGAVPPYERAAFCDWRARDRDGWTTRQRILFERSIGPRVIWWSRHGPRVIRGSWRDAWSGRIWRDVDPRGRLEIDHVVPLSFAWRHGAHAWPAARREAFCHDPDNLIVVARHWNRAKGDTGADRLLPLRPDLACAYLERFLAVSLRYGLALSPAERTDLELNRRAACEKATTPPAPQS